MRNILTVIICFMCTVFSVHAVEYELIDLGTLGGSSSAAYAINDHGQIVGAARDEYGVTRACLFSLNGNNLHLGSLPSQQYSIATNINNNGQIIGIGSWDDNIQITGKYYKGEPGIFDNTGSENNLSLGGFDHINSINDNGIVVGGEPAKIFDTTGNENHLLIDPLGPSFSNAYSINNSNIIVGRSTTNGNSMACIFDNSGNGSHTFLGSLNPNQFDENSSALDVNNHNQIVGNAYAPRKNPGSDVNRACLFDSSGNGNNVNLGRLFNDVPELEEETFALSVNDLGQIVGYSMESIYNRTAACLFDPTGNGNNIDLNSLIPDTGWQLLTANDINNNGWIVGVASNPDQNKWQRAYLLRPVPEPASMILFALTGLMIRKKK